MMPSFVKAVIFFYMDWELGIVDLSYKGDELIFMVRIVIWSK